MRIAICDDEVSMAVSYTHLDVYKRQENEYREFRKNPMASEYLAAENALCKIVQQINWTLIEGLEFEVGFEES